MDERSPLLQHHTDCSDSDRQKVFIIPQRVILSIMGFLAILNAYTMRICLNVAITRMVVYKEHDNSTDLEICPPMEGSSSQSSGGDFDWSEQKQGLILSSFFWGYVITHVPGGLLAEKFGGKYTLSLGILSTAIFTLLTPLTIHLGGGDALIVLRFLEGLGEGTTFPALSALLASWIPLKERSKLGSFVFGGGQVGTILGTLLSGVLLDAIEGWESVFYFFGGLAIIWFIIFVLICYKDPASHPFISEEEKTYLEKELGQLTRDMTLPPTPWKHIMTSIPMLALICAQIGHDFGFYIMVTDLPKYMNDVLRFPIKENGLYSSLPYACMWIVSISTGFLGDWMVSKEVVSITNSRKLFTTIASVFPSIFIVVASYAGCDRIAVVIHFTIAMAFMGTFYPGMKVNPLDLSPNYAGTIMAITNGIGAITGIIAPYLVGVLTPDRLLIQWRAVFWIAFGVFNVTNLLYVLGASGEVQPWNTPHLMNKSTEEIEENGQKSYQLEAKKKSFDEAAN